MAQATLCYTRTQLPRERGTAAAPSFRPMSIVAKRLDDEDDLMMPFGTEAGLGPGDIVLDGNPAPSEIGTAPNFRPVYVCCG